MVEFCGEKLKRRKSVSKDDLIYSLINFLFKRCEVKLKK